MRKPSNVEEWDGYGYPMIPPKEPVSKEEQEKIIAESNERLKKIVEKNKNLTKQRDTKAVI